MNKTRRDFLQTTAVAAAAASTPYIFTSSRATAQDDNSKPTVAAIGVGGSRGRYSRGGQVAQQAGNIGQMIAVCDVDQRHTSEFSAKYDGKLNEYGDYRQMLEKEAPDVVTIGTPDHWHVPIAIAALKAGSHVYCEKPLTLTIDQGKQISKVVKQTGKTFQVGTQQRSENGQKFLQAVAMTQLGYLGDNVNAHIAIGGAPSSGTFEAQPVAEGLDWDFWVGPAQSAPYMEQRRKFFRWFLEYSGGKMTDWGAHHMDISQWALGKTDTGPVKVSGTGEFPPIVPENFDFAAFFAGKISLPHAYNAATKFHINLEFDDGTTLGVHSHYESDDGNTSFGNGILLEGDKGRIFVNRGRLSGTPVEQLSASDKEKIAAKIVEIYGSEPTGHMQNFFNCIASGEEPVSDVYSHHRIMTSCHLCNITLMLGRDLKWDPQQEQFEGDDQATALLSRPSRGKYLA